MHLFPAQVEVMPRQKQDICRFGVLRANMGMGDVNEER